MYGTLMRATVKPENRQAVADLMGEGTDVKGFEVTYVLIPDDDPSSILAAVVFADRESYSANAHDPATEAWYGRFRSLLEADPEWTDGEWAAFPSTA